VDLAGLFTRLNAQLKAARAAEALQELRRALGPGQLSPEELDRAGRFIQKCVAAGERPALRVLILGQCTTAYLKPMLAAVGWSHGVLLRVEDGEYDNVLQDVLGLAGDPPDAVILLPWTQRLLGEAQRPAADRVEDEVAFWRQVWNAARERGVSRIVQVGYDWVGPGAAGHHLGAAADGDVALVRRASARLREELGRGYFVDLEQVSGLLGRGAFYDPRQYFWTRQPFSGAGLHALAEHLLAGVRALSTGPKKVLALDLDNTLWGGVVGETGPLGIALGESPDGEAYRSFQQYLKGLARRGVVLAVASKNNPDDAREPFEKNPDMVLGLGDFAAFEACWDPKALVLQRLAATLNLGLDSFVFFDDNPAEREHIRQALPEVEVVPVPADPAEYVRALAGGLWFESAHLTAEDLERSRQYAVERQRRDLEQRLGSMEDYLRSLGMRARVRELDETDLQRVVQLLGKTNQFNLTTRRHGEPEVRRLIAEPGSVALTLRLEDRFGDSGLVAFVLGVPAAGAAVPTLRIDTWLMSCRVIGRTMEHFTLCELIARALALGYRRLEGEYLPTKKNALVARLYDDLGFRRVAEPEDGRMRYELELPPAALPETFVAAAD
jgi:FkbH-like protein